MVHNVLRTEILNYPEFSGPEKKSTLGSYSVINMYIIHIRNNGCTKEEKIFMVDVNPRGAFCMYTTTSKFHFWTQKW